MKTPVVILGIGKSGLAAQSLLLKKGIDKNLIHTFDEKNASAQFKSWNDLEALQVGTLILSPGVPMAHPHLQNLIKKGWTLTSEINLATEYLTDEIIIGITGSVGKSTVTTLIGEAVKAEDPNAFVGGNLGIPFCEYALQLLNTQKKAKYVILELSSYQLENCKQLKLDYSVITFLSANHLERYSSADEYYKVKCHIGELTKNLCIINKSSPDLEKYKNFVPQKTISINHLDYPKELLEKSKLLGKHNSDNVALALKITEELHLKPSSVEALLNYSGLAHRLEIVGEYNQVLYINDSKATAMDSVLVAASAANEKLKLNKTLHLLLGGKDKNLPWEDLNILKTNPQIKFIFFGECREIAFKKSQLPGELFPQLSMALEKVISTVQPGDIVLLSPGGTSLDEFKNFEDRGNYFKNLINKMT